MIWHGTVMGEKELRRGDVTLGEGPGATFVVQLDDPGIDAHILLRDDDGAYALSTTAAMRGRVSVNGVERELDGPDTVAVAPGDWGIVHLADVSFFFQWVEDDVAMGARGLGAALDFNLVTTTFVAAIAHVVFLITAFLGYDPVLATTALDPQTRLVSILVDTPPDVVDEVETEDVTPEQESLSARAGGEEGRFGDEQADTEDSVLPDHEGPMVDHIEQTELGRAFEAAIGTTGSLTSIFGANDSFATSFGTDFAVAGQGDAYIVGRGDGGLGFQHTGDGGGGDGFGRVHGVAELDTGGGEGRSAELGRRGQVQRRATMRRETPEINGFLSREHIERIVRRHARGFRYCYERELSDDPELAGRISVNWTIGLDGRVASASISENTLESRSVASCVLREARRMRFDQPDGGMVVVTYPFTFRTAE